jgi:DNA-binding response OmpR family regulator
LKRTYRWSTIIHIVPCGYVLIVDDDAALAHLVGQLLARIGLPVKYARTGEAALEAAHDDLPDLVLLDVSLGRMSGYEVCRQLRDSFGDDLPIVFLSGERTEPYDRAAGLLLGGDDYIVKPFDPDELLARVRALLRRSGRNRTNGAADRFAILTVREREVLTLLANGLGQDDIAGRLVISPKTVATHLQRVLVKLGVHSRAQAVGEAYRHGLVAREDVMPHAVGPTLAA